MQDSILVAGYPMGGDSLSITKGIVSRVVMTRYAHASNKLLGIQIDAAINPGNSGGPAFLDLQQACRPLTSRLTESVATAWPGHNLQGLGLPRQMREASKRCYWEGCQHMCICLESCAQSAAC